MRGILRREKIENFVTFVFVIGDFDFDQEFVFLTRIKDIDEDVFVVSEDLSNQMISLSPIKIQRSSVAWSFIDHFT